MREVDENDSRFMATVVQLKLSDIRMNTREDGAG